MLSPNAYIAMLKYGSKNDTVLPEKLIEYLNDNAIYFNGTDKTSVNTAMFRNAFINAYQSGNGSKPDFNNSELYYLKPDALAYLLSYEEAGQSQEDKLLWILSQQH